MWYLCQLFCIGISLYGENEGTILTAYIETHVNALVFSAVRKSTLPLFSNYSHIEYAESINDSHFLRNRTKSKFTPEEMNRAGRSFISPHG